MWLCNNNLFKKKNYCIISTMFWLFINIKKTQNIIFYNILYIDKEKNVYIL